MINLRTLVVGTLLFCIIVLSGCFGSDTPTPPEPSPTSVITPPATATPLPSFGPFIPLGQPVHRNLGTSTEVVRNCVPGAVDPIVKTPSRSLIASHNVEWSVAGTAGIGTSIGGGVLPVEVNLDVSLTTTYGQGYSETTERGTGWQLPAKPNTIVTYILAWGEKWQPGFVEVRLWNQPVIKIDVFYRTDVTSEIVAEDAQDCNGTRTGEPIPTFTPEVTNTETPSPTATNTPLSIPTSTATHASPTATSIVSLMPLREHFRANVGDGLFIVVTYSDGLAPYDEKWLWDNHHFAIQRIRPEEQSDGCDIARYSTDTIWVSGGTGMSIEINGQLVGNYTAADNAHGYILKWPIELGDKICAKNFSRIGFSIIFGPDVYYHYDTYCHRGAC